MNPLTLSRRVALVTMVMGGAVGVAVAQTSTVPARGTVQRITVHGKSLEGNLQGESADREVTVYLPPGYAANRSRRYPVVYLLHGYGLTDQYWTGTGIGNFVAGIDLPAAMDRAVASKTVRAMILVMPNAYTSYGGSMYSSSVTTGDWESYVAEDLVSYTDGHYRTIANRMGRGLAGHSMGGYGTIRIGMKRPDIFSSLYMLSSCCLMNNPAIQGPGRGDGARGRGNEDGNRGAGARGNGNAGEGRGRGGFGNVLLAEGAAWSPNPRNPPRYLDLPMKDGQLQPLIAAKWMANSPLVMIDQHVANLKRYHAIAGDCGLQDGLVGSNKDMDQALTDFGVAHIFETYEGDHTNRIGERMEMKVLPFFSKNLSSAQ